MNTPLWPQGSLPAPWQSMQDMIAQGIVPSTGQLLALLQQVGAVTSATMIQTGEGLTGGPLPGSAEIRLANVPAKHVLANMSDIAGPPVPTPADGLGWVRSEREVRTGAGLEGGGDLTANRTISLRAINPTGTGIRPTVDAFGRVTDLAPLTAEDVTEALGFAPIVTLPTIAALRTYPGSATLVFVVAYATPGDRGGGLFEVISGDTTSLDDGGETIVGMFGQRWRRIAAGGRYPEHFGAKANGQNDTVAFNAALAVGSIILHSDRNYYISNVDVPDARFINLNGASLLPFTGADYLLKIRGYGSRVYGGYMSDGNSITAHSTTTTAGAALGATSITVASASRFVVGNIILLRLDDNSTHTARIDAVAGANIGLSKALPSAMGAGKDVLTCRGLLICEDLIYGGVSNIVFSNQPMALELRSGGLSHGCGKNWFSDLRIDFTQLAGISVFDDCYDNSFIDIQSWGGSWYKSGVATVGKGVGFYLDATRGTLLQYGNNQWMGCSSLGGTYGALIRRSEMGMWSNCTLDANLKWGLELDLGAHKNQFSQLWCGANGLYGGGGVNILGANTIETLFNGLHTRFNGPVLLGPDIYVEMALDNVAFLDDEVWQENRVITGPGASKVRRGSGDFLSASVGTGAVVALTTGVVSNVVQISLPPGDWDVEAQVQLTGFTNTVGNHVVAALTTSSSSVPDQRPGGYLNVPWFGQAVWNFGTNTTSYSVPTRRFTVSATTTVYLNVQASFGTNGLSAYGSVSARLARMA